MSQAPTAKLALERAAASKQRIRIFYGDPETGKDDCDETKRNGKLRKTQSGAFVLLISASKSSSHGNRIHTIDTSRVVRIAKYGSGTNKPTELYRHPNYTAGEWSSYYRIDLGRWIAIRNGLIHATFDDEMDAAFYVAYITGDRACTIYRFKEAAYKRLLKGKTA